MTPHRAQRSEPQPRDNLSIAELEREVAYLGSADKYGGPLASRLTESIRRLSALETGFQALFTPRWPHLSARRPLNITIINRRYALDPTFKGLG